MNKKIISGILMLISLIFGIVIGYMFMKPKIEIKEVEVEKIIELEIEKEIIIEKEIPLKLIEREVPEGEDALEVCGRRLECAERLAQAAEELGYDEIVFLAEREISQAEEQINELTPTEEIIYTEYVVYQSESEAVMLAKTIFNESRGIYSQTEQACIIWTVLNRVDAGWYSSIYDALMSPGQFAYEYYTPTVDDYGRDLVALAEDVLSRWYSEKAGNTDVGRVLPNNYYWYAGDGYHNYFRDAYVGGNTWDYSWGTPYST